MLYYEQFIIIYYVSIPTTPITCAKQGPNLLKLIGWRYCPYFRWVSYIPGITTSVSWRWTRPYH